MVIAIDQCWEGEGGGGEGEGVTWKTFLRGGRG